MVFSCEEGGRRIKKHKGDNCLKDALERQRECLLRYSTPILLWALMWGTCKGVTLSCHLTMEEGCTLVLWVAMETKMTYAAPAACSQGLF